MGSQGGGGVVAPFHYEGGEARWQEASWGAAGSVGQWGRLGTAVGGRRPRRLTWARVTESAEGLGQNH
jgi:hypothetical protein